MERNAAISATQRGKRSSGESVAGFYIMKGHKYLTMIWDHPLSSKRGVVAEHRKVLYDKIGPGPHPCYWCGTPRDWGGLQGINADHLDNDKLNNDPNNLVSACCGCNRVGVRRKVRQ